MKNSRETIGIGILAGFLASLCCVGPLLLIVLGLGTASTALAIGAQKPYFLLVGLVFFIFSLTFYVKRKRQYICEDCTTKEQERKRIITAVFIATLVFVTLYVLLVYLVAPWLAPFIYQNFYN